MLVPGFPGPPPDRSGVASELYPILAQPPTRNRAKAKKSASRTDPSDSGRSIPAGHRVELQRLAPLEPSVDPRHVVVVGRWAHDPTASPSQRQVRLWSRSNRPKSALGLFGLWRAAGASGARWVLPALSSRRKPGRRKERAVAHPSAPRSSGSRGQGENAKALGGSGGYRAGAPIHRGGRGLQRGGRGGGPGSTWPWGNGLMRGPVGDRPYLGRGGTTRLRAPVGDGRAWAAGDGPEEGRGGRSSWGKRPGGGRRGTGGGGGPSWGRKSGGPGGRGRAGGARPGVFPGPPRGRGPGGWWC
jgi:hypothetical protein